MTRQELCRMAGAGCGVWTAWNAFHAHANYVATQALPEPTDWLEIAGPAACGILAWLAARWQPAQRGNVQQLLQAVATLMASGVGGELRSLIGALKTKGFPPQGALSITFQDGTTQTVDWSIQESKK